MLILVAVTVSVALNEGLFKTAKQAAEDTQLAKNKESALSGERVKIGDTWYDSLNDYINNKPSDDQNDEPSKWGQDEKGNITYEGKTSKMQVGDYVDYEKYVKESKVGQTEIDKLYDEDLKKYAGAGSSYDTSTYKLEKEKDLKWRVLDIKDGQIRLISDGPTASEVYLEGYNGYNNAVYLIDKVCSTLYTTEKSEKVQNLKIEDIEDKMDLETWDYHNYTNSNVDTGKYGGTSKNDYTGSNSYYPAIFEKEKKQYIWKENKFVEGTELDLSEQTLPIEQDKKLGGTDDDKIKITQTYWSNSMSLSNWKNEKYQNIFIKDSSGSNYRSYWLSSRCVTTNSTRPSFVVRTVDSGSVSGFYMYTEDHVKHGGTSKRTRPVVTLKPDTKIGEKVGDRFELLEN